MSGLTWAPVEMALGFMNVSVTSARLFYQNQRVYVHTVNTYFQKQMLQWKKDLKGSVTVLVDARYDTPGTFNIH